MANVRHVGVIDIGKTNVKVAVVDLEEAREIGVLTLPNRILPGPPYPHYDTKEHWKFICKALKTLNDEHTIDALSVTTHGASLALLDASGELAAPVLDYEFEGPDDVSVAYDAIRPDFEETGSPRLGMGLNSGAQLHWQLHTDHDLENRLKTVVTYPQYWSYRLTGKLANEPTSLGCHTDLWCPNENRFSALVERLGLQEKMAPVTRAGEQIGTILPQVAEATGLPLQTPVACGIHDSNASLYPHLLKRRAPFSVVSTGTWVIVFAIGGQPVALNPNRDTLINVNAFGHPVPSARFMGGREFETVICSGARSFAQADVERVLSNPILLFPSIEQRSGPFQGWVHSWSSGVEADLSDGERFVAVSFYLALVTAECLDMIGASGPIVVEGPFTSNGLFLDMLEAATGRCVEAAGGSVTGTSIGAAMLFAEAGGAQGLPDEAPRSTRELADFKKYAATWRAAVRQSDLQ